MINFETVLNYSKGSTKQFLVLTNHFFRRLFINDVVSFEEEMKGKIIGIIAILAVFCAHISNVALFKYQLFRDEGMSWVEKCYVLSFFMVLMGLITVLEWDVIFPDARDFSNLITLPIKVKTFFTAKFASLCLFVSLFALGMNSLTTFIFAIHLPQWQSSSPVYLLWFAIVHVVVIFAANFFMFFMSVLLIGLLMATLGFKIFNRISVHIRALLMIVFVFLVIFFISESVGIPQSASSLPTLKETNSLFIYLFPPMWFVGLYETLIGNKDPLFSALANFAVLALIIPALAFFITALLSYRRYLRKMEEVKRKSPHLFGMKMFFINVFNAIFLRNPVQRVVFYFFGKTLKRSISHKMRLISYLAVSSGIILIMLTSRMSSLSALSVINKTLLSVPLILSFFLLVGLRAVINIPVSLEANWIFKITERRDKRNYFSGFRKGIFFFTLVPMFLLLFVFYLFLWGWQDSLLHCLYGLVISYLMMEVYYINYYKIPFTCSYLPGKAKMHVLWIVYLLSFLVFVFFVSTIEYELWKKPSRFLIFYGVVFGLFILIKIYQNYFLYKKAEIIYEEELEPVMITMVPYECLK